MFPAIDLTRFNREYRTNHFYDTYRAHVADENGGYCISKYMSDCIRQHSNDGNQPRYWLFAKLTRLKHEKSAILHNSAVVLEYPYSAKADLQMALADLGFHHFLIHCEDNTSNRIAVIFPLDAPILNDKKSNRYARVASCLMEQIGIGGAKEGCIAPTFLIRPICNASLEAFAYNDFLNADQYIETTAEMKAKAAKFIGDGGTVCALGEQPSELSSQDGLFDWGDTA